MTLLLFKYLKLYIGLMRRDIHLLALFWVMHLIIYVKTGSTPVRRDEVADCEVVESEVSDQTVAFDDEEKLLHQVWSLRREVVFILQTTEEVSGLH